MSRVQSRKRKFDAKSAASKIRKTTYTSRARPYGSNPRWAPFGVSKTVMMTYCGTVSQNPGVGQCADYIFSANGVYDPDITGTGHQPYGFDTLATLYNHFYVIDSRITIEIYNNQTGLPIWLMIALRDGNTSLSGSDSNALLEQPYVVKKLLAPIGSAGTSKLSMKFNAKSFFNAKQYVGDAQYESSATTNPVEQAYFHCLVGPQASGDDVGVQTYQVRIEFKVVCTEPKTLVQS